jgi:hypothetical protein
MSTITNNISKLAYGPEKGHPFAYYTNTGNLIGRVQKRILPGMNFIWFTRATALKI